MPIANYVPVSLLCLSLVAAAEPLTFATVDRAVVESRLERLSPKPAERQANLSTIFAETGCAVVLQPVKRTRHANVLCALAGQGDGTIVVGAHFDGHPAGKGAVDNWGGAALLPSLYQALSKSPRRHRFVFVGFTEEEKGLVGSRFYVKQLSPEERGAIRAYINLDSLGLGDAVIWLSRADRGLASAYVAVSRALQMRASATNMEKVGDDDSRSFSEVKVPTITFHSITQKTWEILHSSRDRLEAIDREAYYRTYTLLAAYLAYLDQQP